MSFHDYLKSAIDYIDANLDGDIDFDIAAQKAAAPHIIFRGCFHISQVYPYPSIFAAGG